MQAPQSAKNLAEAAKDGITMDEIVLFEKRVQSIIIVFEQYFLGIIRIPPLTEREHLVSFIRRIPALPLRTTSARYRLQAAADKFNIYNRRWDINLRKIEDGTYERAMFKAKLHQPVLPVSEPSPPASTPEAARVGIPPAVQRLYEAYVKAREQCGLSSQGISALKIHELVKSRQEKLRTEYPGKKIAFRLEIKDNTPVIKAIVKDE